MNKWFNSVIDNYVNNNSFENYKIKIAGLSDKQQNSFCDCMKFSHGRLYVYRNEKYTIELYTDKFYNKRTLVITNKIQIDIDYYKKSIADLEKELQEETSEEYKNYILEDIEEDRNKLNKLLEVA